MALSVLLVGPPANPQGPAPRLGTGPVLPALQLVSQLPGADRDAAARGDPEARLRSRSKRHFPRGGEGHAPRGRAAPDPRRLDQERVAPGPAAQIQPPAQRRAPGAPGRERRGAPERVQTQASSGFPRDRGVDQPIALPRALVLAPIAPPRSPEPDLHRRQPRDAP